MGVGSVPGSSFFREPVNHLIRFHFAKRPKFDAARGMKFLTYAAPAIRNAMMDMVRDAFAAF